MLCLIKICNMIQTAIRHYIFDFALSHILNKYVTEFSVSKYIKACDLNKSHYYKYLNFFDDGVESYKEGSKWHYGHTVIKMQLVPEDEVGHLMKPKVRSDFWVILYMKTEFEYHPAIILPFVDGCSAILK